MPTPGSLTTITSSIGKGLFAGAVGTAAMTASSSIEAKIRDRDPSTAPADAAGKVLGVKPTGDKEAARFSTLVHWGYGTGWGVPQALLRAAGLRGPAATVAHLGLVWGGEVTMLPQLDVAPTLKDREAKEIAIDVFHHLVYAAATGLALVALDRWADA